MHIYPKLITNDTYNKQQNFEGLNIKRIFTKTKPNNVSLYRDIVAKTGLKLNEVEEFVAALNGKQRNFLKAIAERYNRENFYLNGNLKEDPNIVFEIFNSIKKTNKNHYYILNNIEGSMNFLKQIILNADERTIDFIKILQDKIFRNKTVPKRFLSDMFQSQYKDTYINNINEFKSYLLLNRDNPDAIKQLDLLMKNKSYSSEYFNRELDVKGIMQSSAIKSKSSITKEQLMNNYSSTGISFLDDFVYSYYVRRPFNMTKKTEEILLDMYKTTSAKNLDIRLRTLQEFKYKFEDDPIATAKEIKAMQGLFKKIDSDNYVKMFVESMFNQKEYKSVPIGSIELLNRILENLPHKKLYIFRENVFNIIRKENLVRVINNKEIKPDLIEVIGKNITNPFFENGRSLKIKKNAIRYGYEKPKSLFSKMKTLLINKINKLRYSLMQEKPIERVVSQPAKSIITEPQIDSQSVVKEYSDIIENPAEQIAQTGEQKIQLRPLKELLKYLTGNSILDFSKLRLELSKPFILNTQKYLPIPAEKPISNTVLPPVKELIKNETNILPIKLVHIIPKGEQSIILTSTVKESPKARKLRLIGEVNGFISKKLGSKTFKDQSEIYSQNVTKMRLKLLPEIFASIKETRQIDRVVGKLKSNSNNKDALKLYRLINGNNRKYIKYLLEKKNVDGTRMFEVKDIISMIEKANKHVETMKKANPDFRAKDSKAYFDHLYDFKIEQYGKVKKQRKK